MANNHLSTKRSNCLSDAKVVQRCWEEFNEKFKSEEDCLDELHRWLADVVRCKHCGSQDLEKTLEHRIRKCSNCKRNTWFTSNTFFSRIRSARPWLAAIWLLERGIVISVSKFHKLVNIAYSSAHAIFKKLMSVINNCFADESLLVSSKHFSLIFCKRSTETPAKMHPRCEQQQFEEKTGQRTPTSPSESCSMQENKNTAIAAGIASGIASGENRHGNGEPPSKLDHCLAATLSETDRHVFELITDQPIQFDRLSFQAGIATGSLLAALTMLELAGLVERLTGDLYRKVTVDLEDSKADFAAARAEVPEISQMTTFISSIFHGISRKYLQHYLCAYWCKRDRRKWHPGTLAYECVRSGPLTYRQILDYVSPPLVRVPASSECRN